MPTYQINSAPENACLRTQWAQCPILDHILKRSTENVDQSWTGMPTGARYAVTKSTTAVCNNFYKGITHAVPPQHGQNSIVDWCFQLRPITAIVLSINRTSITQIWNRAKYYFTSMSN